MSTCSLNCQRPLPGGIGTSVLETERSKLDNVQLCETQSERCKVENMMLTRYQDHILTENIWFVWSETSYSGDERSCHGCGTNNERTTNIEDRAIQLMPMQLMIEAEFCKSA